MQNQNAYMISRKTQDPKVLNVILNPFCSIILYVNH